LSGSGSNAAEVHRGHSSKAIQWLNYSSEAIAIVVAEHEHVIVAFLLETHGGV